MALGADEVSSRYPIHWLVWHNEHETLKSDLEAKKYTPEDIELKDNRGRTPLLLAVTLGHTECVRVLLEAGADVNCEKDGWTAVQEATATGDMELLSLVLSRRDHQRHAVRAGGIPDLLNRLSLAPDFYVEMKWQFTSWVPLVSRMCPFDTYKVYKRGGNVRVDTTLVGFEGNRWQRGDRTYIFRGQGRKASMVELDHEAGTSWCEHVEAAESARAPPPAHHTLLQRLAAPLAINYLDTDKISFERNKSGIWGWRQDKSETVNGYECKVFSANNVELVSKTRTEHLPKEKRNVVQKAPLAGLLALADSEPASPAGTSPLLTPDKVPEFTAVRIKVFSAYNVELVSKTRTEHLPKEKRNVVQKAPLAGLLALADSEPASPAGTSTLLTPDKVPEFTAVRIKVFSAYNVELVSKTRTEHLPKEKRNVVQKAPLAGLLALADSEPASPAGTSPLLTPDKVPEFTAVRIKVFSAYNVELVSKTRTEHLPKEKRNVVQKAPLAGLLALADSEPASPAGTSPLLTPDKVPEFTAVRIKVFSAYNVELVSKTRTEHLPKEKRNVVQKAPLAGLLALADSEPASPAGTSPLLTPDKAPGLSENMPEEKKYTERNVTLAELLAMANRESTSPDGTSPQPSPDKEERSRSSSTENLVPLPPVTWQEYFSPEPLERDVGRAKELTTKVQKFRATLWLCEDYPLELQEQIMPILDLMTAISSPHFAKLKDFVQMQLPAGFPVKIEIPLFHVLNARITFGNIFGMETPVPHVEYIQEGERLSCVVDDQCFAIGRGYVEAGGEERLACEDGEEGLLQYAIQQSLMEAGTHDEQVDVWEALRGARPSTPQPPRLQEPTDFLAPEERQLQRAIEASLASLGVTEPTGELSPPESEPDPELAAALAVSAREQAALDRQLEDEQRALDEALRLSLLEK